MTDMPLFDPPGQMESAGFRRFVFLTPAIVGLVVFRLIPIVWAFVLSFTNWRIFNDIEWVGLSNYGHILTSPVSRQVLGNTLWFTAMYVPGVMIVSVTLAVLLNNGLRSSAFFRGAFFLPYITATVAITLAWRWIFSTRFGLLNHLLAQRRTSRAAVAG